MCGSSSESLVTIKVAGSNMRVCMSCSKMGKIVEEQKTRTHTFYHRKKDEGTVKEPKDNYASIINRELAKKGLNIHQLARAVNIKESNLSKYMLGKMKPDVDTIRKIEKFLEISLLQDVSSMGKFDEDDIMSDESENSGLTLGDLIKDTRKKK